MPVGVRLVSYINQHSFNTSEALWLLLFIGPFDTCVASSCVLGQKKLPLCLCVFRPITPIFPLLPTRALVTLVTSLDLQKTVVIGWWVMAGGGWVRALQCKTNVIEDVSSSASFSPSFNLRCGNTSHHIKDIVQLSKPKTRKPKSSNSSSNSRLGETPATTTMTTTLLLAQHQRKQRIQKQRLSSFPTLIPLPSGHSSRKVVEIIFSSSWSRTSVVFSGKIEKVYKVQNSSNAVERFEEFRQKVQSCSGMDDSRCAADGNEMMRFHSAPLTRTRDVSKQPICCDRVIWPVTGDGGTIRTFAGSGSAHDRTAGVDGGGGGRRAMVVSRVIVGRICTVSKSGPNRIECNSFSVRKGELVAFDSTAVLPCFLIIYKT